MTKVFCATLQSIEHATSVRLRMLCELIMHVGVERVKDSQIIEGDTLKPSQQHFRVIQHHGTAFDDEAH